MFELLVNPVHEPSEALILHVAANIAQSRKASSQKLIRLELLKEQQQSRNVCCCSSKLELGLLKEEEGRRKHSSSSTVTLKLPEELPSVEAC